MFQLGKENTPSSPSPVTYIVEQPAGSPYPSLCLLFTRPWEPSLKVVGNVIWSHSVPGLTGGIFPRELPA